MRAIRLAYHGAHERRLMFTTISAPRIWPATPLKWHGAKIIAASPVAGNSSASPPSPWHPPSPGISPAIGGGQPDKSAKPEIWGLGQMPDFRPPKERLCPFSTLKCEPNRM